MSVTMASDIGCVIAQHVFLKMRTISRSRAGEYSRCIYLYLSNILEIIADVQTNTVGIRITSRPVIESLRQLVAEGEGALTLLCSACAFCLRLQSQHSVQFSRLE